MSNPIRIKRGPAATIPVGASGELLWTTDTNELYMGTGSVNIRIQNALTNPVTGTGTTNFLPKFTGASTIGDSLISATSTVVTIESAAANYSQLQLNGAAGYGAELKFGEATGGYLAAIRHNYNVGTGLEFYTGGLAAGNLALYINPSGNISIGNTNNTFKLDVSGTGRFTGSVTAVGTMQLADDGTYGSTYKTLGFTGITNGTHRIFAGTSDNLFIAAASGRGITFWVDGSSGNILTLASTGAATFSTSVTATQFVSNITNGFGLIIKRPAVGNFNGISYQTNNVDKWFVGLRENLSSDNYIIYNFGINTDVLTLNNSTGAATFSSSVTATSANFSGSVTYTSANNRFVTLTNGATTGYVVNSMSNTGNSLYYGIENSAGNGIGWTGGPLAYSAFFGSTDDRAVHLMSNSAVRFTITGGGNVGIGTASPQTELHVKATSGWSEIRIDGASGGGGSLEYYSNGTQLGDIYYDTSSNMIVRTGGATERMRITSGGNVLINGTTVQNNATGRGNLTINGTTSILNLSTSDTNAGYLFHGGTDMLLVNAKNGAQLFYTNDTERMRITSGGNVGINTANPDRALTVNGQIGVNNDFVSTKGGTTFRIGYEAYILTGGVNLFTESTIPLVLGTNATERMRITSAGNVGIGTSPSEKLTINAGAANSGTNYAKKNIVINSGFTSGYTANAIQSLLAGYDGSIYGTDIGYGFDGTGYTLMFSTNDNTSGDVIERMRITSGGNVGIGTTSPAAFGTTNLDVNAGTGGSAYIVARANSNGGTVELAFDTDSGYLSTKSNHPLRIRTNDVTRMTITSGGAVEMTGTVKTGAPSGYAAKPYKLGEVLSGGTTATHTVAVEIDGVVYFLLAASSPP
jgi:hypothetical protein